MRRMKSLPVIIPMRFARYSDAILPCECAFESDINNYSQKVKIPLDPPLPASGQGNAPQKGMISPSFVKGGEEGFRKVIFRVIRK